MNDVVGTVRKATSKRLGGRRPTILDVARLARVGTGTVSRVINKNPSVAPDVRQSVERAIAQLGYEPDVLARSMRRLHTREVGCILCNLSLSRVAPLLNGASEVITHAGSTLMLGLAVSTDATLAHLRSFGQHRIDGVLLALNDEPDLAIMQSLAQLQLKAVFINQPTPGAQQSVLVNFRTGAAEALRCLLGFGHRRVALLLSDNHSYMRQSLLDGFVDAHRGAGLPMYGDLIRVVESQVEVAVRETAAALSREQPPTAIMVSSDPMLAGAVRAIQAAGLTVGRDVSLITMGDSDLADLMTPAITAIRWDIREMGRLAAKLLLDSSDTTDTTPPPPVVMPSELVLRQSCQPALR
jgi:LacI family transcriptional regulator